MGIATRTNQERSVFAEAVAQAAEKFASHGCDDFPIKAAQDCDDAARLLRRAVPGVPVYRNDWIRLDRLKRLKQMLPQRWAWKLQNSYSIQSFSQKWKGRAFPTPFNLNHHVGGVATIHDGPHP